MQDVEITGITKLEGACHREGVHPGEDSVKEVAGNVEALIAPPQLHYVTAGAGEQRVFSTSDILDMLRSVTPESWHVTTMISLQHEKQKRTRLTHPS